MKEVLTERGVVLMGEAANRWVDLQWWQFAANCVVVGALTVVIGTFAFLIYRHIRRNIDESNRLKRGNHETRT